MKRWGLIFALFVSALFVLSVSLVSADSGPDWFSVSKSPSLSLAQESVAPPARDYWGADCRDLSYKAFWIDGLGKQLAQDVASCVHQASFGYIGTYGVRLSGTQTSYSIKSATGSPLSVYPIPGSKNVMTFSQTGSNSYKYIYIYKDFPGNIESVKDSNGVNKYYKLTKPHDGTDNRVKFIDGSSVIVQDQTPVYSGDGRYIFANFGRAQTLIDTQTNTARIIGQNTNPSGGSPWVTLAVNNNASLGFVANNSTGNYTLYNTVSCTANANKSNPELCQSRSLTDLIHYQVPNIKSILRANFLGDQKLELYISHTVNGATKTDRYILYQPGFAEANFAYLGLGDSFASGEGAFDYVDGTDTDSNRCHISKNSYPRLIQTKLSYEKSESIACSGGKIKDVYDINKEYADDNPQAKGKDKSTFNDEIMNNYLPGYRRQWEFVSKYQPEAVTISIGGNDINFGKKLQYCILTQYSCYESAEQKNGILKELKAQFPNLVKTYTDLKNASPNTKIYVVGYPRLVQPGGDCALNVHLSSAELMLADEIVEDLNTVIKHATQNAGVFYVDASNAFVGHKLCEDKSWSLAVNGITLGDDQPFSFGPISNATFHPNKLGHKLFKSTILSQTNSLTEPMPTPDSTVSADNMPSRLNPTGEDFKDAPQPILDDGLFGELLKAGDSITSTISTAGYYLSKGDVFNVEIHSTPQIIGTANAIGSDSLSLNVTVPEGVEPGPHEVHIYGKNIAGEPIDIYKSVLLVASDDDYDGDGILNSQDQCTFINPVSVDSDQDGVDDACDSEILEAQPQPPEPPVSEPEVDIIDEPVVPEIPNIDNDSPDDTNAPVPPPDLDNGSNNQQDPAPNDNPREKYEIPEDPIDNNYLDDIGDNADNNNQDPTIEDPYNILPQLDNLAVRGLSYGFAAQTNQSQAGDRFSDSNKDIGNVNQEQPPVEERVVPKVQKLNRNSPSNWRRTALIFLTGTPFGIAVILLLDL